MLNPLTARMNQFSIEFGLTEQQKEQIVSIVTQELTQLEALKKNTSEKLKPLLNSEQQPKFQAMREAVRRKMIEKVWNQAMEKAETDMKQKLGEPPVGEKCLGLQGSQWARVVAYDSCGPTCQRHF